MKTPPLSLFSLLLCLICLSGCEVSSPEISIEPVGGRSPEVITWISGQQWFPATIAILVEDQEGDGHIYLEANSSENRGYKRTLRLNIVNDEWSWIPLDTLNLLETQHPTRVSVEYEQFRDSQNHNSSKWLGDRNDLGGLRITSLEEEDGIVYAAGEFFMTPYVFINRPDVQEIEGHFNNVRVFHNADDMQAYFAHITAWEAARN